METSDSMTVLADLMTNGIAWPGYTNEDGEEVIVRGYSMENPVIEITISGGPLNKQSEVPLVHGVKLKK